MGSPSIERKNVRQPQGRRRVTALNIYHTPGAEFKSTAHSNAECPILRFCSFRVASLERGAGKEEDIGGKDKNPPPNRLPPIHPRPRGTSDGCVDSSGAHRDSPPPAGDKLRDVFSIAYPLAPARRGQARRISIFPSTDSCVPRGRGWPCDACNRHQCKHLCPPRPGVSGNGPPKRLRREAVDRVDGVD